jgi:hypothetical protein
VGFVTELFARSLSDWAEFGHRTRYLDLDSHRGKREPWKEAWGGSAAAVGSVCLSG